MLVSALPPAVNPIHNRLHASPSGRGIGKQFRRNVGQPVHFAVAAIHQVREVVDRQLFHRVLARSLPWSFSAESWTSVEFQRRSLPWEARNRVQRLPKQLIYLSVLTAGSMCNSSGSRRSCSQEGC